MLYPETHTEENTLRYALAGGSIARFGDGEFRLMFDTPSVSQSASFQIRDELRDIARSYSEHFIPCIPNLNIREGVHNATPRMAFWQPYKDSDALGRVLIGNPRGMFGSSFITRADNAPWIDNPAYWDMMRELWVGKNVTLVAGHPQKWRPILNDCYLNTMFFVPTENAYAEIDEIEKKVAALASDWTHYDNNGIVLISLGAAGTCLAARLAERGCHAVDLGHLHMFMNPNNIGAFSFSADDLASPEYREELRATHAAKPWGDTGHHFIDEVAQFLKPIGAKWVVDYGAGQGTLGDGLRDLGYRVENYDPIQEPFVPPKITDVVVSTDVFEHVELPKLQNVLRHSYLLARKAGFFAIAKQPAKRILAHTGRNAHLICQPDEFWVSQLKAAGWDRVEVARTKWKKCVIHCYKDEESWNS